MSLRLLLRPKISALRDGVELLPHQERIVERLQDPDVPAILAYHGLGSGKTLSSIAAADALGMPAEVVTPASIQENYKKEINKFVDPEDAENFHVQSYNKAVKDLVPDKGKALIVDEAHNLTTAGTARSDLLERAGGFGKLVLLSGSPIRNYPHELAPLVNALHGGKKVVPEDEASFNSRFLTQRPVYEPGLLRRFLLGEVPAFEDAPKGLDKLRALVKGRVDYHSAYDPTTYPETKEETIEVPMSAKQQATYEAVAKQFPRALMFKIMNLLPPSKRDLANLNAFLSAARQVSNTPSGFNVGASDEDSPKIQRAVEELKKKIQANKDAKGVIYSNYLASGVVPYAKALEREGIPYAMFTGDTKPADRAKIVDDYNKAKIRALLISGAGAEGLDLKGTRLMQVLEPHWNNPRIDQAIGRTARYKSHLHLPPEDRNVEVQRFISKLNPTLFERLGLSSSKSSADEYLTLLAKRKQELNEQFLDVLREAGAPEN